MFNILGIGCGEGGGRLAASMVNYGVNIGAINTNKGDLVGLSNIPESKKLLLEISGGGSGKDPMFVQQALKSGELKEKIKIFIKRLLETTPIYTTCSHCGNKEKLSDIEAVGDSHICTACDKSFGIVQILHEESVKHDYIFLFVCLGGGSGSGLINDIIDVCYTSFSVPVSVVCTIPDDAKDTTEKVNAMSIFKTLYNTYALHRTVSPLILVDNQRMLEMYSHMPIGSMYSSINNYMANFINKFNTFSNKTSTYMSTIDTMDTGRLWSLGGCCTMGKFIIGTSKNKSNEGMLSVAHPLDLAGIDEAIKSCVVTDGFDLSTAKGIGVIAVAPKYFLQDDNMSKSIKYTFAKAKEIIGDGLIFNGQYDDDSLDCLEFYIFFNGLKYPEERFERMWSDIKAGKVISQQKMDRIDQLPYEVSMESNPRGETFTRMQRAAFGDISEPMQVQVTSKPASTKRPCPNCVVMNGVSLGIYKAGGPQPFTSKVCPLCLGRGKV